MAYSINRIAGTSELSFQIGLAGLTIYQGSDDPTVTPPTANPPSSSFVDGDLYIRTAAGLISIYAYDTPSWVLISGGAAVTSFGPVGFPRTGDVNPLAGDYDADQVDYDDSASLLPGSPTNVQAAIEALDSRLDALGGPFLPLDGSSPMDAAADITMGAGGQHLADGAAGFTNPAYAFGTDDQSGMYSPGVGELGFATNSGDRMKIQTSGLLTAETLGYTALVEADLTGTALVNKDYVDTRPIPYDLAFYIGGAMSAPDDIVGGMVITRQVRIETNAPGSQAFALTATHASPVSYTVEVDGVSIGTVDFASGTDTGTFSLAATDLSIGQRITMKTPNPAVSGIEDVMITIVGCANTATCNPVPVPPVLIKAIGNTGSNNDQSYAMRVDGDGNIYLAGYQHISGGGTNNEATVVKYNKYGTLLWQKALSSTTRNAIAWSMDVDPSGNVYIAGEDPSFLTVASFVAKYSSAGALQWVRRVRPPGGGGSSVYGALGVSISPVTGDIFHVGRQSGGLFAVPFNVGYISGVSSAGSHLWARKYGNGNANTDSLEDVVVDSAGDLVIVGTTRNDGPNTSGGNSSNAMVLKYDDSGAFQWSKYLGKVHPANEAFYGVAVDSSNNIYAVGSTGTSSPNVDALVAKFDSAGNLVWQREIGNTNNHVARGISIDAVGNLIVTGSHNIGSDGYFIAKLSSVDGTSIWHRTLSGGGPDIGYDGAVDASGSVYVTGKSGLGTTFPALGANENWMMGKFPGDGSGAATYAGVVTYSVYSPANNPGTSTTGDITLLTDAPNATMASSASTELVEIASPMTDVTVEP